MLVSVTPLKDKDGAFTGSFAMFTDITERKTAEETLRETTEYLRKLIDFASAPIIVWNPDFRITRFNHAFEHLTGRVEQEVIGQPLDILFPKESTDASLALIKKTISGERWESVEIPILASDGVIRTVLWNSANILTAEAELISTIAQGVDITGRKQAESALRQSEQFLNTIVEQIPDMIFVKDAGDLRFVRLNKTGEELLGYSRQEMLGKNDYDFFLKTEADFFTAKDRAVLRTNQLTDIAEEKIRTRNMGERILHTKKIPLFDEEGKPKYLLGISEDITERKQAEDTIALANRKLTLMNDVTYQYIQNKVTAIRGYAELSKDSKTETERVSFIKKEDQILADIHQLIKNTKDYQEMGVNQPRWIPVEQSIRIAASIVSPKECISIEPALHGLELYSDPLIEKIFSNLIDNAVKHGKTTTRITFSSDKTPDGLILICEDDGVGISPKVKARLFDRSAGENIHFGLFFVREYLVLSGMTIAETGTPGKGARFEITVPKGMFRFVGTG
jgi:PAS domain S-box-containing protein